MTRAASITRNLARTALCAAFIGGGISHFILGSTDPSSYADFSATTLLPALQDLWANIVMPNIRAFTAALGVLEIAAGIGIALTGRVQRAAAFGMLVFFAFLLVLGYAFPAEGALDDLLKNRLGSVVLAALALPFALRPDTLGLARAWRRALSHPSRRAATPRSGGSAIPDDDAIRSASTATTRTAQPGIPQGVPSTQA